MDKPIEFLTSYRVIEGWIWSSVTLEQVMVAQSVVNNFITIERFPDEKQEIVDHLRLILLDTVKYQKEKITINYENRKSVVSKDI